MKQGGVGRTPVWQGGRVARAGELRVAVSGMAPLMQWLLLRQLAWHSVTSVWAVWPQAGCSSRAASCWPWAASRTASTLASAVEPADSDRTRHRLTRTSSILRMSGWYPMKSYPFIIAM